MIRIINRRGSTLVTKSITRVLTLILFLSLAACGGSSGDGPDEDDPGGGIFGTGIQINGTVSTQFALIDDGVEYKRQSGETGSEAVQGNGTFAASDVTGTGAVLLRTTVNNGDRLYALALPEDAMQINQNIHSYSDLVARNWFASNGQDIDAVFDSGDELSPVPTAAALASLEQAVSQIFSNVQDDYDLQGANIFNDVYLADGSGIDEFLVVNPVLINNGVINIFFIDPSTNTQTQATSSLSVDSNLLLADTENPSAPAGIRALPAASNEIVVLWDPAFDNVAIARYDVFRDGELAGSTPFPVFSDLPVAPGVPFTYTVVAIDSSGNQSAASQAVTAETLDTPDSTAPTSPFNVLMMSPLLWSVVPKQVLH